MSPTAEMTRYSVEDFVNQTSQKDRNQGFFELESDRILEINLSNNLAWMKRGAMIAYTGSVKFTMEDLFEHGVKTVLKRFVSGESGNLVKAEGSGSVYVADCGKKIVILNLNNESITAEGTAVLAFEPSLKWDIKLNKPTAMMAGGLTNIHIHGSGMLALTTAYDPLTLKVTPGNPVYTDPTATIAWSGNLQPSFKTDVSLKTLIGRGSGDSVQMKFEGEGFVIVQPDSINYGAYVQSA
jgi:uncharacterized protein (AIM24 family)